MRLNFATLSDSMQKNGGQVGHGGQPVTARLSSVPTTLEKVGTLGDTPCAPTTEAQALPLALSPVSPACPPLWGHAKPLQTLAVPVVPNAPPQNDMNAIDREAFEERAAIMEFDGGLSRAEAERLAHQCQVREPSRANVPGGTVGNAGRPD
jgi:hypothetical protein